LIKELSSLLKIKGDPEQVRQVVVNLIDNALKAMSEGGNLTIKSYLSDEHQAVVEISDIGKGIPSEIKDKIFDPFFTTRHEGVGLGLSICYRIIREHGGTIEVQSKVGKGTTIIVRFPISS
jgi:signal transduction histidine kinase